MGGELQFVPKYLTTEQIDRLINSTSEESYNYLRVKISVDCKENKQSTIANMKYFWDNKISEQSLSQYFPAYYLFYELDKWGYTKYDGTSKLYPSEKKNDLSSDLGQENGKSNYSISTIFLKNIE